jgi:hypothetical protein
MDFSQGLTVRYAVYAMGSHFDVSIIFIKKNLETHLTSAIAHGEIITKSSDQ